MNTQYNVVHTIVSRKPGIEVKFNFRYWGAAISWGDSLEWKKYPDTRTYPVWFVGLHFGPMFISYSWVKNKIGQRDGVPVGKGFG